MFDVVDYVILGVVIVSLTLSVRNRKEIKASFQVVKKVVCDTHTDTHVECISRCNKNDLEQTTLDGRVHLQREPPPPISDFDEETGSSLHEEKYRRRSF